jgi:hypothetical protein
VRGFSAPARDVQLASTGILIDVRYFSSGPLRRQQGVLIHSLLLCRYLDIKFRKNNKKMWQISGKDHLVAVKEVFKLGSRNQYNYYATG